MADKATDALQGIPFQSLIGGPLQAAVKAQSDAAMTTWTFIKEVGMTGEGENRKALTVDFVYTANGEMQKLTVPLLTIVPIPYIAIDEIDIQFKAKINASESTSTEQNEASGTEVKGNGSVGWGWAKAEFNASYSSKKDSKATQDSKYSVEYTMDVHVHAGQESMPAGLAKVLGILESSIAPTKIVGFLKADKTSLTVTDVSEQKIQLNLKNSNGNAPANTKIKVSSKESSLIDDLTAECTTDATGKVEYKFKMKAASIPTDTSVTKLELNFTANVDGKDITTTVPVEVKKP
jgi:hypothetical protein